MLTSEPGFTRAAGRAPVTHWSLSLRRISSDTKAGRALGCLLHSRGLYCLQGQHAAHSVSFRAPRRFYIDLAGVNGAADWCFIPLCLPPICGQ